MDVSDFSEDFAGTFDISLDSADGICSINARIEVGGGIDSVVAKVSLVTLALSGLAAVLNFGLTVNSGSVWKLHLEIDADRSAMSGRGRVTLRTTFFVAALLAAPALVVMLQEMTVWARTVEVDLGVTLPLTFVTSVLPAILRRFKAVV